MRASGSAFAAMLLIGVALVSGPASADCVAYQDYIHLISCFRECHISGLDISGHYVYAAEQDYWGELRGLQIIDIADPENPQLTGSLATLGEGQSVVVSGHYAYMTCGVASKNLTVIDVADPSAPRAVGNALVPADPTGLAMAGTTAFVADGVCGLWAIDVSHPENPQVVGQLTERAPPSSRPFRVNDVAISDRYAYLAGNGEFDVVDIADPSHLRWLARLRQAGGRGVAVSGSHAYLVDASSLYVIDVSIPQHPSIVGTASGGGGYSITLSGGHALVSNDGSTTVLDIASPEHPKVVATVAWAGSSAIGTSGDYAYIAGGSWGNLMVAALGNYRIPPVTGGVGLPWYVGGVAVSDNYAYVTSSSAQFFVMDVSDPRSPQVVATLGTERSAGGVVVSGDYAFVTVAYPAAILVIDVQDPRNPQIISHLDASGTGGIAASGSYVYYGSGGIFQVIDVADPYLPHVVGSVELDHGWWGIGPIVVSGSRAYVAVEHRVHVVDVTDPASPTDISVLDTGDGVSALAVTPPLVYAVGGYDGFYVIDFTDLQSPQTIGHGRMLFTCSTVILSGTHLVVGDWGGGPLVFDVSDPRDPALIGRGSLSGIAMNMTASGTYIYVADEYSFQILPLQCEQRADSRISAGLDPAGALGLVAIPNPASSRTTIRLRLPAEGRVTATIYNVSGRQVRSLPEGILAAGPHDLPWDGRDDAGRTVAPGVYLARVSTPEGTRTARVVIIR